MNHALWKELWTDEKLGRYTVPGMMVVVGGGLLVYTGYWLGMRKSKMKERTSREKQVQDTAKDSSGKKLTRVNSEVSLSSPESLDGSEKESPHGDVYRCALIVRKDCGLARGKMIIHCCRAFLAEFKKLYKQKDPDLREWERDGMTVVVLRAENENELTSLKVKAAELNVSSHIFVSKQSDSTSLKSVMALGPSKSALIKDLTKHLLRL